MFGEPVSRRPRIIGAIGLIALAVALAVGLFLIAQGRGLQRPADVEALFERSPNDREAARALKANFPADYQRLLQRVIDVSHAQGQAAAIRETAAFMERFIRSKTNAIIAAPDRELQRIGGGQLALIRLLRVENVRLCAQYAVSGPAENERVPPAALPILARLSVYIIEAAHAGEQPGRTPRPTLSDADSQAWFAQMRTIDPNVARQIETDTATRQPPQGQCQAGLVLYEAATRLPGHISANVTAYLVRESLNPSPPAP
jgi:hypothetical protein